MKTVLQGTGREVIIEHGRPTIILGERINPTGKSKLAAALAADDLEIIRQEALAQVDEGATILDINVGIAGADEVTLLPKIVELVMETVDVPISIDTANIDALKAALATHKALNPNGKALVNSVNGEDVNLTNVLPLVAEYGAAVIGLCMDDDGIPGTPEGRLRVAGKILERAEEHGIPQDDILIDCLAMTVGADTTAGWITLKTIQMVKETLGVNMTLGVSNISFGLPEREGINIAYLVLAIANGLNCLIVDAAKASPYVLAADLLLNRDDHAMRYLKAYRRRKRQ